MFRTTISVAVVSLIVLLLSASTALATVVDIDFTTNPGWLEYQNRPADLKLQDFGFSDTNNAGGTAGEIGGLFRRGGSSDAAYGYYGMDIGTLNLNQPYEMNWDSADAAKMYYSDNDGSRGEEGMFLGLFNRSGQIGPWVAKTGLGLFLSEGRLYDTLFLPSGYTLADTGVDIAAGTGTLRMLYDPNGGTNGRLNVNYNGTNHTLDLTGAQRGSGEVYNTFGFFSMAVGPAGSGPMNFYLDDVHLGEPIPEPGTLLLLATGLAGLLAYAWRKRK